MRKGGARAAPFDAGDPTLVAGVHSLRRELLEPPGGQGVPGEPFAPAVLVADIDGPDAALAAEDRYVGRGPGLLGEQAFAHHRVDQGGLAAARDPDDADGQLGAAGRLQKGLKLRRAGRELGGISVSTSVMKFHYRDFEINLLDTQIGRAHV